MLKVLSLPQFDANEPQAEPEGPPEYALTFPVPGPDGPGRYVFLSLTPDGRPSAVLVDDIIVDDKTVAGYLGEAPAPYEVRVPKEAPWMLVRRELTRFQPRAEVRRAQEARLREMGLLPSPGEPCPIHGVVHGEVDAAPEGEDKGHGQYL